MLKGSKILPTVLSSLYSDVSCVYTRNFLLDSPGFLTHWLDIENRIFDGMSFGMIVERYEQ